MNAGGEIIVNVRILMASLLKQNHKFKVSRLVPSQLFSLITCLVAESMSDGQSYLIEKNQPSIFKKYINCGI
jgi:hypothetical protein